MRGDSRMMNRWGLGQEELVQRRAPGHHLERPKTLAGCHGFKL